MPSEPLRSGIRRQSTKFCVVQCENRILAILFVFIVLSMQYCAREHLNGISLFAGVPSLSISPIFFLFLFRFWDNFPSWSLDHRRSAFCLYKRAPLWALFSMTKIVLPMVRKLCYVAYGCQGRVETSKATPHSTSKKRSCHLGAEVFFC